MDSNIVLVCGMFSSASTWAFNATVDVLRFTTPCLVGFAAELDAETPSLAIPEGTTLVLKSHGMGNPAAFLDRRPGTRCIITLREPRDAVTSLMKRFGYGYHNALFVVAHSAAGLAAIAKRQGTLLLRYESGFMDDPRTVRAIADFLGLRPSDDDVERIFLNLRPDAVRATIAEVERLGRFPKGLPPSETADPVTQWHPDHIGDRVVGKFARFLHPHQQSKIIDATPHYCATFGYAPETRSPSGIAAPTGSRKNAIAIDATTLHTPHSITGIGRYVRNMIRSMAKVHDEQGGMLVVVVGNPDDVLRVRAIVKHSVRVHVTSVLSPSVVSQGADSEDTVEHRMRKLEDELITFGVDTYFDPNPLSLHKRFFLPKRIKLAAMIHDIIPLSFKSDYSDHWNEKTREEYNRRVKYCHQHLGCVLFPSEATHRDYLRMVGLRSAQEFCVTSEGVDPIFLCGASTAAVTADRPFMLAVSSAYDRRKNLGFTLLAFRRFVQMAHNTPYASTDLEVVLAPDGPMEQAREICQGLGIADRVRFRCGITDAELLGLYSSAALLVCASSAEGFGLPVIEALACGTPVLRSNLSALAEFQLEGWIATADLSSEDALAASMLRALAAPRGDRDAARRYVARFDWDDVARRTCHALSKGPEGSRCVPR